jgi:hypothetical protein
VLEDLPHAEAIVYCPECAEREFGLNLLEEGGQSDRKRGQRRLDTTLAPS